MHSLGQLTGDQIAVVVAGSGNEHIGVGNAGFEQIRRIAAVAVQNGAALGENLGHLGGALLVGLDEDHLVASIDTGTGQVLAYLASTHDDNVHALPPLTA